MKINYILKSNSKARVIEWIKKTQDPHFICYLQNTHFSLKNTHKLKVNWLKEVFHVNGNLKRARVAILISHKINLKSRVKQETTKLII